MARWADFEEAAPELAGVGRDCVEGHGFMLLGTVRRDGTARISPVGVRIVDCELTMSFLAGSMKECDVRRDPRILLHSPVVHGGDPNSELKLRGRAIQIDNQELLAKAALWDPPPPLVAFAVDLESAALLEWSKGEVTVTRWNAD
jgi:Pyridoxamine 5'-phosphate oxidase